MNRGIRPIIAQRKLRRGYVLLLTLAVILLAAHVTAGLARHSLRLALGAAAALDDLQDRWGRSSIERTLFPAMQSAESGARHGTIRLGDRTFAVSWSDESAKLNLNALLRERGRADVEQAVRWLGPGDLPRRIRPLETTPRAGDETLDSWGQVFDLAGIDPHDSAAAVQRAARRITLWGDGRLNIRRAEAELVLRLCRGAVDERTVRELVERQADHPREELHDLLRRLALAPDDRQALSRLLTTRSSCFGLWVASDRGAEFCAWDRSDPRQPRTYRTRW